MAARAANTLAPGEYASLPSEVIAAVLREVTHYETNREHEQSEEEEEESEEYDVEEAQDFGATPQLPSELEEDATEQRQRARKAIVAALVKLIERRSRFSLCYCIVYTRELLRSIVTEPEVFYAASLCQARVHVMGGLIFAERHFCAALKLELRNMYSDLRARRDAWAMTEAPRAELEVCLEEVQAAVELRQLVLSFASALVASVEEPTF
jgi:hypothetical protein